MAVDGPRYMWYERLTQSATAFLALAVLLFLDGRIGPQSLQLRRTAAVSVLVGIAATRVTRGTTLWGDERLNGAHGSVVAPEQRGRAASPSWLGQAAPWLTLSSRNQSGGPSTFGSRVVRWAAFIAGLNLVAVAPSAPIALVGFVVGLAALQHSFRSSAAPLEVGLIPACLSYVAMRFAADLVTQSGAIAQVAAKWASMYVSRVRGVGDRMSFTELGGPVTALAALYLFSSWRSKGGVLRVAVAGALAFLWLAFLPAAMADFPTDPLGVFCRTTGYGVLWLAIAALAGSLLPSRGASHQRRCRSPCANLVRRPLAYWRWSPGSAWSERGCSDPRLDG